MERATKEKVREKVGEVTLPALDNPALQEELQAVMAGNTGIAMLLLSTGDGRSLAHCTQSRLDPRRISAMSNSFLTLGETLSRELGLTTAEYVTMSTAQGSMVLVRVMSTKPCTLAALGHSDTSLAILLYAARDAAARLLRLM